MPLDPQCKVIIDLVDSTGGFELTMDTPPQQVRDFMTSMAGLPSEIACAHVEDRSIPGPHGDIPVRIYRPEGDAPKPTIVYYHGGGWVIGSIETHDDTCRGLADAVDALVVSVDYRLAPEHTYPVPVEDCFAALQ